jgi:hypothetical protein
MNNEISAITMKRLNKETQECKNKDMYNLYIIIYIVSALKSIHRLRTTELYLILR